MEICLAESEDSIDSRFHLTHRGAVPSIVEQGARRLPTGERVDVPTGVLVGPVGFDRGSTPNGSLHALGADRLGVVTPNTVGLTRSCGGTGPGSVAP